MEGVKLFEEVTLKLRLKILPIPGVGGRGWENSSLFNIITKNLV